MAAPLQTFLWFSIVAPLACLAVLTAIVLVTSVRYGGRREEPMIDHGALSVSRFTIPVSVIVPAGNDTSPLETAIDGLLGLNYPEFEVIVVVERDGLLEDLKSRWGLQAREFFYRRTLKAAPIESIHRSSRDPRLMVIRKSPRGRADAVNCGVNLARFRYITRVDPVVRFDPDALLRAMAAALTDPARTVGASSHIEVRATSARTRRERLAGAFEHFGSLRSLMNSRLAWRRLDLGLGPGDGVVVWRRDAVVQAGGFSATAADIDLELMVRLQLSGSGGDAARVVRTPEIFGWIDFRSLSQAVVRTKRRCLSSWQATLALSQALMIRGRGAAGTGAARYFVMTELVAPFVQFWIVLAASAGGIAGLFTWRDVVLCLLLLSFGNALVTNAALLLRGAAPEAPAGRELRRLVVLAPLSFPLYSPVLVCAHVSVAWSLLSSRKTA